MFLRTSSFSRKSTRRFTRRKLSTSPSPIRQTIPPERSPNVCRPAPRPVCPKEASSFVASTTTTRSCLRCSMSGCAFSRTFLEASCGYCRTTPRQERTCEKRRRPEASIQQGWFSAPGWDAPNHQSAVPRPRGAAEFRARCLLADLYLDTLPYNGHGTASDMLWAGLPVLTCAGSTFAGRVAGSLLHAVGLPELVTASLEEYQALALKLARGDGLLGGLRTRLQRNRASAPL